MQALMVKWGKDDVPQLAASLAFYGVLSLAPTLILVTLIVGVVYSEGAARQELISQTQDMVGSEGAQVVDLILQNATKPGTGGVMAAMIGLGTLLFGASNVVLQLQTSLDRIWDVAPDPRFGLQATIKSRLFAFLIILGVSLLFLASLVLSIFIARLQAAGASLLGAAQIVNLILSLVVFTLLFAVTYKVIPHAQIRWRDVWIGAAVTALLVVLGRSAMSVYIGGGMTSMYGAAGALMALLLGLFSLAQIVLLGAEFTQVYANIQGRRIAPTSTAMPLADARALQHELAEEHMTHVKEPFN